MIIIAFDPGVTTGYAWASVRDTWEFGGSGQHKFNRIELWGLLLSLEPKYVVAEAFEYRRHSRAGLVLESRNVLGVLELWCELNGKKFSTQSASEGKGYFTNARLKAEDVYQPNWPHANDAARHLLHFFTFKEGSKWKHKTP